MAIFGVTYGRYTANLQNIGLTLIDLENTDNIPKVSQVFIYDCDGIIEQFHLKALITNGCNVVYTFNNNGENNAKYLSSIGCYNIYGGVSVDDITADYVMHTFENRKTLEDVSEYISKTLEVSSFSMCVNLVDQFINAINNKDQNTIMQIFNDNFNQILDFKRLLDERMLEVETIRKDNIKQRNQVEESEDKVKELTQKLDTLIKTGRTCEEDNKKLSQAVISLSNDLNTRNEELKQCKETISTHLATIHTYTCEIEDMKIKVLDSNNMKNVLEEKNNQLLKQIDVLSSSMNAQITTNNITIQLTQTGSVQKILYIKAVDIIPYIVSSLRRYPTYVANRYKKSGCAFMLVVPKDSTLSAQYVSDDTKITDSTNFSDAASKMYVLEDFNPLAEKFIQNCGCEYLLILDLTLRSNLLTQSLRQQVVYTVNNPDTIKRLFLNPKDCIAYSNLTKEGVIGHIPTLTESEIGTPQAGLKLRDGLYAYLDNCWR